MQPPGRASGCCATAREGGAAGYDVPGYHLKFHLHTNVSYDATRAEWTAEIDELIDYVNAGDGAAALRWYDVHFPECMKLVPRKGRIRRKFLDGVRAAIERGI